MSKRSDAQAMLKPGDAVTVTNHYITVEDHPCYGTRTSTVVRSTSAGLTLQPGGHVPWPKAADIVIDGQRMELNGHPNDGDPFLEINLTSTVEVS